MNPFLKGKQIYLRAIALSDATEEYVQWINDPEVTKGLVTGVYPSGIEELRDYIKSVISDNNTIMMAVCDHDDVHIGNIKLDRFDHIAKTAELGLMIGNRNYWGKGIGSEMCELILKYAFKELNLRKVSLTVYGNNLAAIKLYQKLGFIIEGTLKKHVFAEGDYHDKLWMSYFNPELL